MRPPTPFELLFDLVFFAAGNGALLGAAWLKSRHSVGVFRGAYYAAVAPLVIMVCTLCWQWLFDATAANLWPIGMVLLAMPCGVAWLVLLSLERRRPNRESDAR